MIRRAVDELEIVQVQIVGSLQRWLHPGLDLESGKDNKLRWRVMSQMAVDLFSTATICSGAYQIWLTSTQLIMEVRRVVMTAPPPNDPTAISIQSRCLLVSGAHEAMMDRP